MAGPRGGEPPRRLPGGKLTTAEAPGVGLDARGGVSGAQGVADVGIGPEETPSRVGPLLRRRHADGDLQAGETEGGTEEQQERLGNPAAQLEGQGEPRAGTLAQARPSSTAMRCSSGGGVARGWSRLFPPAVLSGAVSRVG